VLLRIPASPDYASLNLAMAVQLVTYEIFRARADHGTAVEQPVDAEIVPLATPLQMQQLYAHFEQVLDEINFKDRTKAGTHLMTRIRRLLQRAEPDQNEANILRGILTAIQGRRRTAGSTHAPQAVYLERRDHAGRPGGQCADARMSGRGGLVRESFGHGTRGGARRGAAH
jgi:tRNA C32,U32 (ribose-2'-O)-methylase TrmJ